MIPIRVFKKGQSTVEKKSILQVQQLFGNEPTKPVAQANDLDGNGDDVFNHFS